MPIKAMVAIHTITIDSQQGYDWTVRFLADYEKRRNSKDGKHMMGMLFKTDDHQYLSQKAILPLTKDVVSGTIENPEELTTYSWRRMLPTLGPYRQLAKLERLALGN